MTSPPQDDGAEGRTEQQPEAWPAPPDPAQPPRPAPDSQYGRYGPAGPPPYGQQPHAAPGQPAYGQQPQGPPPGYAVPGSPPYGQPPYGQQGFPPPGYGPGPYGPPGYGQPPYGPPPFGPPGTPSPGRRSKAGLVAARAGVLVLLVVGGTVLAFATRSEVLDPRSVERDVAAQFEQREGVGIDLDCADDMTVDTGASYECTGVTADDEDVTLKITITDKEQAAYTWQTEP